MVGGSCVQHPCRHGERLRSGGRTSERMQDEAKLVVHHVSADDSEALTDTRMEAVSNYNFGVESLVGSMSDRCSRRSSKT
jgi:hypothetical protein